MKNLFKGTFAYVKTSKYLWMFAGGLILVCLILNLILGTSVDVTFKGGTLAKFAYEGNLTEQAVVDYLNKDFSYKALDVQLSEATATGSDKKYQLINIYTTDELDSVLPRADVIFSVLPGTPATTHIYTAERFKAMKDTAIFINCGRGSAVDMNILYEALRDHEIASAAVDVFEVEPLPEDSPLWGLDNLLVTPHTAGFYHLKDTLELIVDIAAENLDVYLHGGQYRNVVDFETGYKK